MKNKKIDSLRKDIIVLKSEDLSPQGLEALNRIEEWADGKRLTEIQFGAGTESIYRFFCLRS